MAARLRCLPRYGKSGNDEHGGTDPGLVAMARRSHGSDHPQFHEAAFSTPRGRQSDMIQ